MRPPPEAARGRRIAIAAFVAVLVALAYFAICRHAGKLSQELVQDDVSYAVEAADRIELFLQKGAGAFLADLVANPPHSPWQTLLALAALALGGLEDAALYAANGVVLVAIAIGLAWELRRADRGTFAIGMAALLSAPLAYLVVDEFRPDILLGLATALAAWRFLGGLADRRRASFVAAGLALGAALLVKPTFFAHTLALAGLLCAMGLVLAVPTRATATAPARPWHDAAMQATIFLGTGFAAAAAYWAVAGREIVAYFWTNTQGPMSRVWAYGENLGARETLRLAVRDCAVLGRSFTAWAALATLAFAVLLWRRGARQEAARLAAFLAVGLASFAIIAAGGHPSPFFYATVHWVAILGAIFGLAMASAALGPRARHGLQAGCAAGVLLLFGVDTAVPYWGAPSAGIQRGVESNAVVLREVWTDLQSRGFDPEATSAPPRVIVMVDGDVNHMTLRWEARRLRLPVDAFGMPFLVDDETAMRRVESADYVVMANPVTANFRHELPDAATQAALAPRLLAGPRFRLVSSPDPERRYYVLANEARAAARAPSRVLQVGALVISLRGLAPQEGPYPLKTPALPALRWMTGDTVSLCFIAQAASASALDLEYFAVRPGRLDASLDGRSVGEAVEVAAGPGSAHIPLPPNGGARCLGLRMQATEGDSKQALFFSRIALEPGP